MARPPRRAPIVCDFFIWHLRLRSGVYYADGRFNDTNLGKHSLGSRDYATAMENLRKLDFRKAIELGKAQPKASALPEELTIEEGWKLYLEECQKPQTFGGVSAGTWKRYRSVRDKHVRYCLTKGIKFWSQVNAENAEGFGLWLHKQGYAERSVYLEVNAVKTVVNRLIDAKKLLPANQIKLPLVKPDGCDAYCYTFQQVSTMVLLCGQKPKLKWLEPVLIGLTCTGLRISELASLRWSDVDFRAGMLQLTDERWSHHRKKIGNVRRTKGKRTRSLPIHPDLLLVLKDLPRLADGRIFHGPKGGMLNDSTVRHNLVAHLIEPLASKFPTPKGEVGFAKGRLHSFRHYFTSESFRHGATEADLLDWLGHRDSKMVAHYRHLRPDESKRRMRRIKFLDLKRGSNNEPE